MRLKYEPASEPQEGKWPEAIKAYSDGIKRDANAHLIFSNRAQVSALSTPTALSAPTAPTRAKRTPHLPHPRPGKRKTCLIQSNRAQVSETHTLSSLGALRRFACVGAVGADKVCFALTWARLE